tara:strand:+ start:424 stop:828 length:405 start_codon:yes stop_codon:yes gene_type:complete
LHISDDAIKKIIVTKNNVPKHEGSYYIFIKDILQYHEHNFIVIWFYYEEAYMKKNIFLFLITITGYISTSSQTSEFEIDRSLSDSFSSKGEKKYTAQNTLDEERENSGNSPINQQAESQAIQALLRMQNKKAKK